MVIKRHYPNFEALLNSIPDHRTRHTYKVAEIISAGLLMFVLKRESRNQTDQLAGSRFEGNYLKIFGMRLPIMDTVHQFLEKLPSSELEKLREHLVRGLMERKVLEKWKFQGRYHVSFDATGIHTFEEEPFEGCPYKETKNSMSWYASVLEAKLICANGFSLSLGTEWLVNQNGKFDKQDCELAAFKRLAAKIKTTYPRMALLVTADGLYCCDPVFTLIGEYGWKFILTFKDDSLKTLWKTIRKATLQTQQLVLGRRPNGQWLIQNIAYLNDLQYKQTNNLSFVECLLQDQQGHLLEKYAYLTNLAITPENARHICKQGRMRWTIENEGFNTQKNQGFALGHKYARKNFNALQNYYLLMQIAHLIFQLLEKLKGFQLDLQRSGKTLMAFIEQAIASLSILPVSIKSLLQHFHQSRQLRY